MISEFVLFALFAAADVACPDGTQRMEGVRDVRCVGDSGRPHGPYLRLYPDGATAERGSYARGERVGVWERLHPSGALLSRVTYANNRMHGEFVSFHDDGRLWEQGTYDSGLRRVGWMSTPEGSQKNLPVAPLRNTDASGVSAWFPIQADAALSLDVGKSLAGSLSLGLVSAHGEARFAPSGAGRGTFVGVGGSAAFGLLPFGCAASRCLVSSVGPAVRYGVGWHWLTASLFKPPAHVVPDVALYAQLSPRYARLLSDGREADAFGGRLELGLNMPGWTVGRVLNAQAVNFVARGAFMLLGLINWGFFALAAAYSTHVALHIEMLTPDNRTRFVQAGLAFGIGF